MDFPDGFSLGGGRLSPIVCKEAPLSTMYILSFDFMIGFDVGGVASSLMGEQPLKKFVLCTALWPPLRYSEHGAIDAITMSIKETTAL